MRAEITTDGERILAKIPWAGGQGKEWAKLVPGRHPLRDEDGKFICWSYPLTMDTCRTFRRVFGGQLSVSKPLADWARAAITAGESLEQLRDGAVAKFSTIPREAPFLSAALNDRPYQVSGAAFMVLGGQVILGDEPGLGKTLQALAAVLEGDAKTILVVCPKTATRSVWEREVQRWTPTIEPFIAQGSAHEREMAIKAFSITPIQITRKMLIVNKEMVRVKRVEICPDGREMNKDGEWPARCSRRGHNHKRINETKFPELFSIEWDAIIMDESHHLLASTANTMSKHITQGRYGAVLIRRNLRPQGLALALSGTPARSNLTNFWGTLNWCRPDVFTSYWNFAGNHFGVTEGRYGKVIADGAKVPKPVDPEAFDAALRPYYLVRTKQVAAPDLPPITYTGTPGEAGDAAGNYVWVDMEDKQRKAYREMEDLAEAEIRGGTLTANGVLAELIRLRQFAVSYGRMDDEDFHPALPSAKIDWILQFLEEHEGSDSKILIASQFTKIVHMIDAELRRKKISTLTLTGATTDRDRVTLVRRFNDIDDPVRVAVINSIAGGEAITLDSACDDLIIVDPLWTSAMEEQLVSRIHRVSRIHNVFVHRLVTPGTVEEWMVSVTEEQRDVISASKPQARKQAALEAIHWSR
jgi:SNF2 family DNA or RNA helicase